MDYEALAGRGADVKGSGMINCPESFGNTPNRSKQLRRKPSGPSMQEWSYDGFFPSLLGRVSDNGAIRRQQRSLTDKLNSSSSRLLLGNPISIHEPRPKPLMTLINWLRACKERRITKRASHPEAPCLILESVNRRFSVSSKMRSLIDSPENSGFPKNRSTCNFCNFQKIEQLAKCSVFFCNYM